MGSGVDLFFLPPLFSSPFSPYQAEPSDEAEAKVAKIGILGGGFFLPPLSFSPFSSPP